MRTGRRVAFDIGKVRIGVAVSDPHGILATPREFIARSSEAAKTISELLLVCESESCIEVYVGLPTNLKNLATPSTEDAVEIALALQSTTTIPVRLIDERLTTKLASAAMSSFGKNTKSQRGIIDSASAAVILETALQDERSNGSEPGIAVEEYSNGQ
jgi:putative Holliday junction resolvase